MEVAGEEEVVEEGAGTFGLQQLASALALSAAICWAASKTALLCDMGPLPVLAVCHVAAPSSSSS
eukprot:2558672-Rhodomonas_salina.1